jgi:hypothetical protein
MPERATFRQQKTNAKMRAVMLSYVLKYDRLEINVCARIDGIAIGVR